MNRVLIADDHPIMLSGLEALLRGSEYKVVATASNGADALAAFAEAKPDIVILVVRMPERTRLDVLRTLRSKGDQRPVVLLTADLNDDQLIAALELGVSGVLLKDGAQTLLLACLDKVRNGGRWIETSLLERALMIKMTPPGGMGTLLPREEAVVALVAKGLRNREVAAELGLTEGTVKVYLYRICEKLGVGNRTELALVAREQACD